MRKILSLIFLVFLLLSLGACSRVEPGYVGVKVNLLGGSKGVDHEVLGTGRYWIGFNEQLFLFPVFTQQHVWTKDKTEGSPTDESMTFQTSEGLSVNTDLGIAYKIKADMVAAVFQKYRKGVEEITGVYLRNMVRDAFNSAASTRKVESVYGAGRAELLAEVERLVRAQADPIGIEVERIWWVNELRLPEPVIAQINGKIAATQEAEKRENEVRMVMAEANKAREKARGEADAILLRARAEADANLMVAKSLTPELVHYRTIEKWSGALPQVTGGGVPLISLGQK